MSPILFRRLTPVFASAKTNATEKYREDLEKIKVNGPGKRKLGHLGKNEGEWTGEAEMRTRKKLWH